MSDVVKVGLVGFGVVGTGLVQCLQRNQKQIDQRAEGPIRLVRIADLDVLTPRSVNTAGIALTNNVQDILDDPEIDVVVELVGGTGFAFDLVANALRAGKDVVTANKSLLATRGHELFQLAEDNNRLLLFEAAVAGGIPIIHSLRSGLAATEIERIYGILNGTANYILTRMEEAHLDFDVALIEAKAKGYAEADPTYDIEGHDTAHKITLLSQLAFGCQIDFEDVSKEGITRLTFSDLKTAKELGYRIKLLAVAKNDGDGIEVRCHPALIPLDSQLAAVSGVFNAIVVVGNPLGPAMFYGQGAGGPATGSAVASDLIEAARQNRLGGDRRNYYTFNHQEIDLKPIGEHNCAYYIRLLVLDRPGVVADVARILADESISIAGFIQRETEDPDQGVPIVLTTHQAPYAPMSRAMDRIAILDSVVERPLVIRIEDFQ